MRSDKGAVNNQLNSGTAFWDALAPEHAAVEDNLFDLRSVRRLAPEIKEPVLVIGAGQGLIVAEVQKWGLRCDGIDFSAEMVRQAKLRRGLDLIQADARAMPLEGGTYRTVIFATGVIDFNSDEEAIAAMLKEGKRVLQPGGTMFVAFYRTSPALVEFLTRLGLLKQNSIHQKECMESYLLGPMQMVDWVAAKAGVSRFKAALLLFRMAVGGTFREKMTTLKLQKIFRDPARARAITESAPETQPYRDEAEIGKLFGRLGVPGSSVQVMPTCFVVRLCCVD